MEINAVNGSNEDRKERTWCISPARLWLHGLDAKGNRPMNFNIRESISILAHVFLLAIPPCTLCAQERNIATLEFPVDPSLYNSFPLPIRGLNQPVGGYPTGESYCNSLGVPCGPGSAIVLLDLQGLSAIVYARSLQFPEYPDILIVNTLNFFQMFEIHSRDEPTELAFGEELEGRGVEGLRCNDQGATLKIRAAAAVPLFEVEIDSQVNCFGPELYTGHGLESIAKRNGVLVTTTISISRAK